MKYYDEYEQAVRETGKQRKAPAPRAIIDNREFVKAWMTHETIADVSAVFGVSDTVTSSKASSLRAKGVKLPKKQRVVDYNSVHELNKIIAKYEKS